ncbi:Acetyltransferase (GNAT) domain-containing protein [Methylobacterium sp. 174MFSha1.1]|uniref:GNAT family N-acetyltransferase n=1 Tax=Methylobacterium sp. 174MFSha1.1 TaxID=1502749 RepID=UPI0008E84249|nr:GNAT family N-acetyltransferase [Methylobacterium sp. 174MFSha1.1]SFU33156.1 Acetyltransferase (GNAT) domain-containing protein [Methylobacterium sp. 174MFSha1.1]
MAFTIRPALRDDAAEISRVVLSALHGSNARDYGPETIARFARNFTPDGITAQIAERQVLVAMEGGRLVGTASRDGHVVRAVFVAPDAQAGGIGRALMAAVERAAEEAGVATLTLQSSLTATGFYNRLGYRAARENLHGEERTIIMEKRLTGG